MFTGRGYEITSKFALQIVLFTALCAAHTWKMDNKSEPGHKVQVTDGGCNYDYDVDYLDLAISWGPGACSTDKVDCRKDIKSKFTIHGLWPQRRQHSTPVNCCTKAFYDGSDVKTVKKELREHWPAIANFADEKFWPYEWNKHGTCATRIKGVSNAREYFEFTLSMFKKWDILKILAKNNIVPGNQNHYSGQQIINVLTQAVGREVRIDCVPSKKDPRVMVLTQVHICFGKNLQLTNCRNSNRKCRERIRFLERVW